MLVFISIFRNYLFFERHQNWWGFGSFSRKTLFCYSLSWQFGCGNFPVSVPVGRNLPGETGRMGSPRGSNTSFAKTCFSSSVGKRSPKKKHLSRFLIAYLAFLDFDSCSVNPQVVGSSPTGGAKKTPPNWVVFFWLSWCIAPRTCDYRSVLYRLSVAKEVGSEGSAAGGR